MSRALYRKLRTLAAVALLAAVSGCYMPVRWDAEIEITRTGYYSMIFDGYIAKVDLFEGLKKGEIDAAGEREWIEKIRVDLTRDPSTKEFKYYKAGHFKLHWERAGDLLKTKAVTFIRRNEYILGIAYNKETYRVSMLGKSLKRDIKQRLRDSGLDSSGELRVITDAKVESHNATLVKPWPDKGPRFKMYIWRLPNILAPTPAMQISLR